MESRWWLLNSTDPKNNRHVSVTVTASHRRSHFASIISIAPSAWSAASAAFWALPLRATESRSASRRCASTTSSRPARSAWPLSRHRNWARSRSWRASAKCRPASPKFDQETGSRGRQEPALRASLKIDPALPVRDASSSIEDLPLAPHTHPMAIARHTPAAIQAICFSFMADVTNAGVGRSKLEVTSAVDPHPSKPKAWSRRRTV